MTSRQRRELGRARAVRRALRRITELESHVREIGRDLEDVGLDVNRAQEQLDTLEIDVRTLENEVTDD